MAKFIFRLQNILEIKERMETQERTAYAQAAEKHRQEELKLNELIERQRSYEESLRQAGNASKLNIKELKRLNDAISAMKQIIQKQYLSVKVAEKNLSAARARLNQAVQERKTYEKLKEKAFDDFRLEEAEEEKKEIDQLVSFTYNGVNKVEE